MEKPLTLPLDADNTSIALCGGKGANLAKLIRAGISVPGGFSITTHAYHLYIKSNNLEDWILETANSATPDDWATLDKISAAIRGRFAKGVIPQNLAKEISEAYASTGSVPIAVRSSATTEDLPELSFAGQHDTFLNVVGDEMLLQAVVNCWSSLWTARAIGYRARNGIDHKDAALAVVLQEMVQSEASGVLFTANPLTGKRTETVIDATLGLGEALVSGQVEPDHYVVDPVENRIISKNLGAKSVIIRGQLGGGTITVENRENQQALPDPEILELAQTGRRVALSLGDAQDIEWAWARDKLFVLQSRPITSLFPVPDNMPPEPLQVLLSFGAIQGMLDPITPLGQNFFYSLFNKVINLYVPDRTLEAHHIITVAGERIFLNVTGAIRHRQARSLIRKALTMVEPGINQALEKLLSDPALTIKTDRINVRTVLRMIPLLSWVAGNILYNLLWPDAGRARVQRKIQAAIDSFHTLRTAAKTLAEYTALFDKTLELLMHTAIPYLPPALASGFISLRLLYYLTANMPGAEQQILETTRGLQHNVTTEMDLALWQVAVAINADPAAATYFRKANATTLTVDLMEGRLPAATQKAIDQFLLHYGMRGVAEIDIGRPRWRDNPLPLVQVLQSYLRIDNPQNAPDAVFERSAASAEATIDALIKAVRKTRFGRLKTRLAKWSARRIRALLGLRESPKFTIIRMLGILREGMQAGGRELAESSLLANPDDIFFLQLDEIKSLAAGERQNWRELASRRREDYERERRRRQVPRLLLSDGRAFFEGAAANLDASATTIAGSPVSPGVVEGVVRIVLDPHGVQLLPGEILVCPGTDPAWTPLFLVAGGLVMEVGGLMTHGSVVAREYGIPAVVGVHQATTRLKTGQRIRVDGSMGRIDLLS
jgi:rifampicin phosphotransferase